MYDDGDAVREKSLLVSSVVISSLGIEGGEQAVNVGEIRAEPMARIVDQSLLLASPLPVH